MFQQRDRILIVDNDLENLDLMTNQLSAGGYEVRGLLAPDLVAHTFEEFQPDAVFLKSIMPGKSGIEIMKEIRARVQMSEIPIVFYSTADCEEDRIQALEMGADDYLTKGTSSTEMIARTQALIRRSKGRHRASQTSLVAKQLTVDFGAHRVFLGQNEIPLTLTEFKILKELLHQSGQVLTRDRIRRDVLCSLSITDRTIDVHMASLRRKLNPMRESIETIRGVGYRLSVR